MPSLFRHILASLLCGVIVLGHAPAWLHVGTCEGHGHVHSVATPSEAVPVCPHGCEHHSPTPESAIAMAHSHESGNHPQHDSDTCVTCQSLASPGGVTGELLVSLAAEFVSQPIFVAAEFSFQPTLLSIPQPRGPPAAA